MPMTNDEVFKTLKEEGIKQAIKGYIANVPEDNWTIFTHKGNVFIVNDFFFTKYSLNPIFKKENDGSYSFKEWKTFRFKRQLARKRMKERAHLIEQSA